MLNPDFIYPHDELNRNWQLVCLNQFHDILPGSSIEQVYIESRAQYHEVQQSAQSLSSHALSEVSASLIGSHSSPGTFGLLLANPTSFKRDDLVFWPSKLENNHRFIRADGSIVYCQREENGVWLAPGPVAPYGFLGLNLESGMPEQPAFGEVKANSNLLENDFLRVEFNDAGDITRIFDKANQREVLPSGSIANQFQAFEDRPVYWDAWDIERAYDDKLWLSDPAQEIGWLKRVHYGLVSRLTAYFTQRLYSTGFIGFNSPRLDFFYHHPMARKTYPAQSSLPVDVLATQATYEIQWGNLQRPTHENTSWDWARFEVCAHKWADLSEGDYGVSLLNDCKFGHDIHDRVMRLSLLRSPTEPDAHADEGEHTFAYSLLPHKGGWDERTIAAAYSLNDPWLILPLNSQPIKSEFSLVSVDTPNVVIETVKQAEDGAGLIVRLYESQRCHHKVTLRVGFALARVWRRDLLENPQEELTPFENQVQFELRPYQIVTLRLQSGIQ